MPPTPTEIETLRSHLSSNGVAYLMASFADMHGVSKTKMVPLSHIDQMLSLIHISEPTRLQV
mgnify:CR=1 FL=1